MDFLIKFAQVHETFRLPEIEALAIVQGVDMKVLQYSLDVRFLYRNSVSPASHAR